jgi:hypothetical protein
MNWCVKQFSAFINDNYHLSIRDEDISDIQKLYTIELQPGTGAKPLLCDNPSHDHTLNEGFIQLKMLVEVGGEANILTVVAGCWKHGTSNMSQDMKGCGIGTALMLIAECIAIAGGVNNITLDDSTTHEEGRYGFYESLGYNRPEDDEVMEKYINIDDLTERITAFKIKVQTLLKDGRCAWIWDLHPSVGVKRSNEGGSSKRSR